MSKRSEEAAMRVYPVKDYNKEPNYIHTCDTKMLDEVYREVFKLGYKQAEKDTIERVCKWLKENATYTHPRKGIKTCIINLNALREAMEEEL